VQQATWAAAHKIPFFVDLNVNGAPCGDAARACEHEQAMQPGACASRANCDAYYDPQSSVSSWEQYFKPINGLSVPALYEHVPESSIFELDYVAGWMQDILQMPVYQETATKAYKNRHHRVQTVAQWVQPTDEITAEADRQWATAVIRCSSPKPLVLGVHMRGTDKYIGAGKVGPDQYFPLIDSYIKQHEGQGAVVRIYLATDDATYQQATAARYGERLAQQEGVDRASGSNAVWNTTSSAGAHARGMQVVLDALLLSRCDYLLKSNSAVSEFATYFNPSLITNSYDFGLPDRTMPMWAAAH